MEQDTQAGAIGASQANALEPIQQLYWEVAFEGEDLFEGLGGMLMEMAYEGVVEEDGRLKAYIPKPLFDEEALDQVAAAFGAEGYFLNEVPLQNWNATWEANYAIVTIGDAAPYMVVVHAPFHQNVPDARLVLNIEPKMSFGTGHHATTRLMLRQLLSLETLAKKRVVDVGAGTGVLAIAAMRLGAKSAFGFDIEAGAVENALENATRNNVTVRLLEGDAEVLPTEPTYDVLLANITRNVLLADLPRYIAACESGANVFLSGFHGQDAPALVARATELGLLYAHTLEEGEWASLAFVKP